MGYTLRALVGQPASFRSLIQVFPQAVLVELAQGLSLLPLPDELLDELMMGRHSDVLPLFSYLTQQLEAQILYLAETHPLGYLEADYFGGEGMQAAVFWQGGQRHFVSGPGYGALNKVLRALGVHPATSHDDEFDAVDLGRHRHTEEWLVS